MKNCRSTYPKQKSSEGNNYSLQNTNPADLKQFSLNSVDHNPGDSKLYQKYPSQNPSSGSGSTDALTNEQLKGNGSGLVENIDRLVQDLRSLAELWNDDRDPTTYYYQSLTSHADFEMLMQQMQNRKLLWYLLLLNAVNIANLLIPFGTSTTLVSQQSTSSDSHNFLSSLFSPEYSMNLVAEGMILCSSIFVCFCSHAFQKEIMVQDKAILCLILVLQYSVVSLFIVFPRELMFQFLVNASAICLILVFEVFQNSRERVWGIRCQHIILANTFFVNYIAIDGVTKKAAFASSASAFSQGQSLTSQPHLIHILPTGSISIETGLIEETLRNYLLLLGAITLAFLITQYLNQNLAKMLVQKINQLQRSLEIKDTYNASMIHELRNPLNAVLGSIGLLKYSKDLTKEDLETLNIASVSGEILITLINNALDGAKLEANRLELDPHMTDLVEILTKTVSLFQWKAKEKQIQISLMIGKKIPDQIEIDEARLMQILVNIIGNAVKFTPIKGTVKVRARYVSEKESCERDLKELKNQLQKSQEFFSDDLNEDDDYEDRFFDNKELSNDIRISEELSGDRSPINNNNENLIQDDNQPNTMQGSSSFLVNQGDQNIKKKRNSLQVTLQNFGQMNHDQIESFTSLCNIGSLEEKNLTSKCDLIDRDLYFKNSFHEWTMPASRITGVNNLNGNLEGNQRIPTFNLESNNQQSSGTQHSQTENNPINSLNTQKSRLMKHRDSLAFSESLNRDISFLTDSNYSKKAHSNTYSSSSQSNIHISQKKYPTKSKFYQLCGSDKINDDYSDDFDQSQEQILAKSEKHQDVMMQDQNEQFEKTGENKGTLVLEIIDNGIGMSAEGIRRLFQPFSQADKTIQTKYGGTGLGLWISNKLVGLMRGKINVTSELNKGSIFMIEIPVNSSNQGQKFENFNENLHQTQSLQQRAYNQRFIAKGSSQNPYPTDIEVLGLQDMPRGDQDNTINEICILMYLNEEIIKKLFRKYLEKNRVNFKFASSIKEIMRQLKEREYRACFIDIDVNVKTEDLEKLVTAIQKNRMNRKSHRGCSIYCLFSRDIDKAKTRFLQKNNILCMKKPIQGHQLSKILKKVKNEELTENSFEIKQRNKSNRLQDLQNIGDVGRGGITDSFQVLTLGPQHSLPSTERSPNSTIHPYNNHQALDSKKSSLKINVVSQNLVNTDNPTFGRRYSEEEKQRQQPDIPTENQFGSGTTFGENLKIRIQGEESKVDNMINQLDMTQKASSSMNSTINNQIFFPIRNSRIEQIKQQEMSPITLSPRNLSASQRVRMINTIKTDIEVFPSTSDRKYNSQFVNQQRLNLRQFQRQEEEEDKRSQQMQTPQFNLTIPTSSRLNSQCDNGFQDMKPFDSFSVAQPYQEINANSTNIFALQGSSQSTRIDNSSLIVLRPGISLGGAVVAPQIQEQIQKNQKQQISMHELAVLIVDDNKMNQFILQRMLEKLPQITENRVELILADNGQEAYDQFKCSANITSGVNKVKLILMDCEMPVLNGYEASIKIRENENQGLAGQLKSLIIGLSGNSGEQHLRKCKQSGMNDAITKPIAFDQLNQIVKKAFDPYFQSL